jgi:hypothetical protein
MISMPRSLWLGAVNILRSCGRGKLECVVYAIGPTDDPEIISDLVHPDHTATPSHYEVSQGWLHQLGLRLKHDRTQVRLQIHTHLGQAFHSRSDDEGAIVYTQGFLSLVLPNGAMIDDPLRGAYLAVLDSRGEWRRASPRSRIDILAG